MAILENGKIFIGTGEVIEGGTVAIHDHLIAFVGPTRKVRSSKKDTSFDISGKAVLPGLIIYHLCTAQAPVMTPVKDSIPQLI
jgi:imidazolonepropionase-like amidohydrolase